MLLWQIGTIAVLTIRFATEQGMLQIDLLG